MSETTLESSITELAHRLGSGVSFVELSKLPGFSGDKALFAGEGENIVLWNNCSADAVEALNSLMLTEVITVRKAHPLVYALDGYTLNLPMAKGLQKYKKPHWYPAVIDQGPRFPTLRKNP